jgi:MFS family permease
MTSVAKDLPATPAPSGEPPYPSPATAWYAVAVLMIAYVSSFIDRQILFLLVGPIRRDLAISDTEMSLLLGLSFAVFYTLLGVPIARLADSRNRRTIIATGIAVWSAMTVMCGIAESYDQLLVARIGVGIGEAALAAPAFSLIADSFPAARLGTAMGAFSTGIYVGAGLANLIGGLVLSYVGGEGPLIWPVVGSIRPWQSVFFIIGLPGLAIAALTLTLREPARRGRAAARAASVGEIARYLRRNGAAFLSLSGALSLNSLVNFATAAWLPTYLIRRFGWAPAQTGYVLGTLTVIFGTLGVAAGGRLADALAKRGYADARLRVCLMSALLQLATGVAYLRAPTAALAVAALVPFNVFAAFPFGAAAAAVQEIAPPTMRAQLAALYLVGLNLLGLGLGPTAVALLTDRVFRSDAAVGAAVLTVTVAGLSLGAVLLFFGRGAFVRAKTALSTAD